MKIIPFLISCTFVALLFQNCCNSENRNGRIKNKTQSSGLDNKQLLPQGDFYAKTWRHSDTIDLIPFKKSRKVGGMTELYWTIRQDSIHQRDSRGLEYFNGEEFGTYRLEKDNLKIRFKKADQIEPKRLKKKEKYLKFKVLAINDSLIRVVKIYEPIKQNGRYRSEAVPIENNNVIQGDIILR